MTWTGHVACMGDMRNAYRIFVEKPEENRPPRDLGVYEKIILEWM
jgi:hypothetical protein